jgi:hypothetical protein
MRRKEITMRVGLTIVTALAAGTLIAACGTDDRPKNTTEANGEAASTKADPCAPGDLTAAVTESPAPGGEDKLFRLTFTAADSTTSCYLSGPPQAMVFRDAADTELPVTVRTDSDDTLPKPVLVNADLQAEVYVTTPLADADTAAARTDFTMPSGTTFSLDWPSPVGSAVTVTPVTKPVS